MKALMAQSRQRHKPPLLASCGMSYVAQGSRTDPQPLDFMPGENPTPLLTCSTKLRRHQRAAVELVVGGDRGSAEEAVGTGRLERGWRRGRRGAGAHR